MMELTLNWLPSSPDPRASRYEKRLRPCGARAVSWGHKKPGGIFRVEAIRRMSWFQIQLVLICGYLGQHHTDVKTKSWPVNLADWTRRSPLSPMRWLCEDEAEWNARSAVHRLVHLRVVKKKEVGLAHGTAWRRGGTVRASGQFRNEARGFCVKYTAALTCKRTRGGFTWPRRAN
jgi:hypothetical protein